MSPYVYPGLLTDNKKLNHSVIVRAVGAFYGIETDLLYSVGRRGFVPIARFVCFYLLRQKKWTYTSIGDVFKKDHTTVISGVKKIAGYIDVDPQFKEDVSKITEMIYA